MKYITRNHPEASGTWALCADGQLVRAFEGTHGRELAVRALVNWDGSWQTITAAAADDPNLVSWASDPAIAFEGETSDGSGRVFDPGCFSFRQFPLPLMAAIATSWGHDGAMICGRIDEASVKGGDVIASGMIDTSTEFGADVARMVDVGSLRSISIDPGAVTMEETITEFDDEGWPEAWELHFTAYQIGGATLLSIGAFENARVKLTEPAPAEDAPVVARRISRDKLRTITVLTASGEIPLEPPLEWFDDPMFTGLTRWSVDDDGRVAGHLAPWSECHIGIQDSCVLAPHSATDYGFFQLGRIKCAEGCQIDIGTITFGIGHADKRLNARAAAAHYDDTRYGAADVAVGEDAHGIWVAGALRPMEPERIREIRAARLSGDWRGINGNLELVATLAVNVGGFPVYEEELTSSGEVQTMIASLMPTGQPTAMDRMVAEIADLKRLTRPLAIQALKDRVHTPV